MPYYVTDKHPDCEAWATVKDDGELLACHGSEQDAIDQMVAVSISEDMEPGGTYEGEFRAEMGSVKVGDYVSWLDDDELEFGEVLWATNLEAEVVEWDNEEGLWYSTGEKKIIPVSELNVIDSFPGDDEISTRAEKYDAPSFMRNAAKQGLKYYEEGFAGDGLRPRTVREARLMADGQISEDKWRRLAAWIARHMPDLDAPAADPSSEDYPSAGVVAHLLWGSGPSKDAANRALSYAKRIVAKLDDEERMSEDTTVREDSKTVEVRVNPAEFEIREDADGMTFEGYAAVFNSRSENLGGFTEFVAPGAFTRSLKTRNDVKLLWNHDTSMVLGSTRARTLTLTEDSKGLRVSAKLPNTSAGRDAAELLKRGDVDAMSFGFTVLKDSWNGEGNERTLNAVRLHEVSIVAFPAYTATAGTATVRSLEALVTRTEVDAEALESALTKLEAGEDLDNDARNLLTSVIDKLSPSHSFEPEPEETIIGDLGLLELKKKKISLLEL